MRTHGTRGVVRRLADHDHPEEDPEGPAMSDDVLAQAAERASKVLPPALGEFVLGHLKFLLTLRTVPEDNERRVARARAIMDELAGMTELATPAPAVDDHPTLATLLCDITGLSLETWPVVCDVTVIELADRLTAAGYVRTGAVDREAAAQAACDAFHGDGYWSSLYDRDPVRDLWRGIVDSALLAAGVVRETTPVVDRETAEQFTIEIDWCDPPRRRVGPFPSRESAHDWASEHIQTGEWCVSSLTAPDQLVRGTVPDAARSALELIDATGCKSFTGNNRCWNFGRTRGAEFGADAWCDPCIARNALNSMDVGSVRGEDTDTGCCGECGGELEVYNRRGEHMGVANIMTGELIKPAVRGRKIDV